MATYSDQQDHYSNFVLKRKQLTRTTVNSTSYTTWFTTPSDKWQFWLWVAPETQNGDSFNAEFNLDLRLNEYPYLNNAIGGGETRVRQSRDIPLVDGNTLNPLTYGYAYNSTWVDAMNKLGQATSITLNRFSIGDDSDENEDYMTGAGLITGGDSSNTIQGLIAPSTQVQYTHPSVAPADGDYEWYINLIYLECDYVGYDPSYPLAT